MTYRALELLDLDDSKGPAFLLDIGCGSGLSGQVLEEEGHFWVGLDISKSMLGKSRLLFLIHRYILTLLKLMWLITLLLKSIENKT